MLAMRKPRTIPTEKIAPGHVLINVSTSSGGLRYVREYLGQDRDGARVETEYQTRKIVDHEGVVKAIDKLVKEADYVLRSETTKTTFGFFVTDEKLPGVLDKVEALKAEMRAANKHAELVGSAHRGRIGVIAARLDIANPDTLRECYRTIRETLEAIYEALRAGDVRDVKDAQGDVARRGQLRPALLRARNLESMAIGMAGEAIKEAIACAKEARAQIAERIEQGDAPEVAGRAVDLTSIETAIVWFSDSFGGGS